MDKLWKVADKWRNKINQTNTEVILSLKVAMEIQFYILLNTNA